MKTLLRFNFLFFIIFTHSHTAAEIKVRCTGQGDLVYLIGGGPAFTTWNLQPIQEKLARYFKVCRWDMRGVGENARQSIDSDMSALEQWLDDMDKVIPHQPVTLWGHSWGALQVLLFAKTYPDRVVKLILSNPVDPSLLSMAQIDNKLFDHPDIDLKLTLDQIGTPTEKLHTFRSKIASYFADGKQGWDYALKFSPQDSNKSLNVRIWEEYKKTALSDAELKQLSGKISGLIYCRDDVLQPESQSEYQRLLKNSRHHVIGSCGHFPWEENPEDYFRVLMGIFKR